MSHFHRSPGCSTLSQLCPLTTRSRPSVTTTRWLSRRYLTKTPVASPSQPRTAPAVPPAPLCSRWRRTCQPLTLPQSLSWNAWCHLLPTSHRCTNRRWWRQSTSRPLPRFPFRRSRWLHHRHTRRSWSSRWHRSSSPSTSPFSCQCRQSSLRSWRTLRHRRAPASPSRGVWRGSPSPLSVGSRRARSWPTAPTSRSVIRMDASVWPSPRCLRRMLGSTPALRRTLPGQPPARPNLLWKVRDCCVVLLSWM